MPPDIIQRPSCGTPIHTGLLREELLVSRYLLGLDETPFPTQNQLGPPLPDSRFRDILFLSIHIGGTSCLEGASNHPYLLGISILDTRRLRSYRASDESAARGPITSHQLQVGQSKNTAFLAGRFLFGENRQIEGECVKTYLQRLVRNRFYVLVTYGGGSFNYAYIQQLGMSPLYHLDVLKVVQFPLQTHYRYSLGKLLDTLKLPWHDLRVAGNDARFTLHALLMAIVKDWNFRSDKPKTKPSPSIRATLSTLKAVATAWRAPDQEQPSLIYLFEGYPELAAPKSKPEPSKKEKKRPEKTPEEKALRRERKRLGKEKKRLKEARRPQWLYNLGNLLDDE
ncbi:hypothetical protein F5B21DRAFT_232902 [Xylaria acuta]|nr:hypothetical protein F5B21DRAFT_232902 [Xylaria acuta]